jgi:thiosulfate/3-mercaptopyruvate sulfurtransferase
MSSVCGQRVSNAWLVCLLLPVIGLATAGLARPSGQEPPVPSDPWTSRQTMQPVDLAKRFEKAGANTPLVLCVGFGTLYRQAHIPSAEFRGPASTADGLADLKKWAGNLPRGREIVIYCGCCPFAHCPNVRPAFTALLGMGFKSVRVLVVETSLGQDWIEKGYPTVRRGTQ